MNLEEHFSRFRNHIIGIDHSITGPFGELPLIYADWIASGRLYRPIERRISEDIGPMVANTHSEASTTGKAMTRAYHRAQQIIKEHVGAGPDDILISSGSGMTAVVNKLQRILGLKTGTSSPSGEFSCGLPSIQKSDANAPVVFVSHMEHHSNHISWLETSAEVVVLEPDEDMGIDPLELETRLQEYADRPLKIGAFTAASNVTGFTTPYRDLARIMHNHGGFVFVDFAASAPYVDIDMHPADDPLGYLDGIYFSPHKFLGGPGSAGVLVFNKALYRNAVPDNPGGGTVTWTNRWGERSYITDIEAREDGGTPPFLQTIRTALCIGLKQDMKPELMADREHELLEHAVQHIRQLPGVHILGDCGPENYPKKDQLGVISLYFEDIHHNLVVALLNDRFGIQVRGGCSCAGTYGHWLLHVTREESQRITREIDRGDLRDKPGWVRISLHPTMSNEELGYLLFALTQIREQIEFWKDDYEFNPLSGEYDFCGTGPSSGVRPEDQWFSGIDQSINP